MTTARAIFGEFFAVGKDILSTVLNTATKVIQAQTGDSVGGFTESDQAEWWQHTGFASRPALPTKGAASCQGLILKHSDHDVIFATRDTRGTAIYGNLKDGETCVYASAGAARTLWKSSGAIVDYTTQDNTPTGVGVSSYTGPDSIALTYGSIQIKLDATAITLTTGTAGISIKATGEIQVFGVSIDIHGQLASIAGDVATCIGNKVTPLVPAFAALKGPNGPAGTPSTNVFISA